MVDMGGRDGGNEKFSMTCLSQSMIFISVMM